MEEISAGVLEGQKHDEPSSQMETDGVDEEAWDKSARNARNWSALRKVITTVAVSGIGFVWYV